TQVKRLDGRVRVAARNLQLERGDATSGQVGSGRVGDATCDAAGNGELIGDTCALRRRDNHLLRGAREEESGVTGLGSGSNEHATPDSRGVGAGTRVRCTGSRESVYDNRHIWVQPRVSGHRAAQPNLLLHGDQGCESAGQGMTLQATQQVQQHNATSAVIYRL